MHTQQVQSLAEFDALADRWNHLSGQVPFRRWEWNRAWWRHYGHGHQLFILSVHDDTGAIIGIAPWYIEQTAGAGRVIRLIGSGEVCTEYATLLTEPGREIDVCDAVAEWLANPMRDGTVGQDNLWDLLELKAVDVEDDVLTALALRFASDDFTVHEQPGTRCWRIPLPATWDGYLAMLSKPTRRRVRSVQNRLLAGECTIRIVTNETELNLVWNSLVDLHQRRRVSLGEPGCFASEPFGQFLREVSRQFLRSGHLHMVSTQLADRPVAAALNFVGGGVMYAYQVGIDPDALAENPGWLVNAALIQHAIERRFVAFDLLRGDEPYKAHLRATARPCREIRIVPNRLRSQLWHTAWRTGTTMKTWIKTSLGSLE